jgi:hypothetical protein
MDGGTKLQDISCPIHGAIITSIWLPSSQGNVSAFAFGCADGSIQVYARPDHKVSDVDAMCRKLAHCYHGQLPYVLISFKQGHENPVEHIALDRVHNRIASVARGGLRVWDMADDRRFL